MPKYQGKAKKNSAKKMQKQGNPWKHTIKTPEPIKETITKDDIGQIDVSELFPNSATEAAKNSFIPKFNKE